MCRVKSRTFIFFFVLHFKSDLTALLVVPFTPTRGHTEEPLSTLPSCGTLPLIEMREEFNTLSPLCTHELALSTRPGAREKLTLQQKLAYARIRTPDLTTRRFRGYQLDHRGDRYPYIHLNARVERSLHVVAGKIWKLGCRLQCVLQFFGGNGELKNDSL